MLNKWIKGIKNASFNAEVPKSIKSPTNHGVFQDENDILNQSLMKMMKIRPLSSLSKTSQARISKSKDILKNPR